MGQHVDGGVDDHAAEGEEKAQDDEWAASTSAVRCEGEDEQHRCARHVGRDRVKIRLDAGVAEPAHDLGEEERDGLQRHAETHLDREKDVGRGLVEDLERVSQGELFVDGRGRVDLDAVVGEFLLLGVEELGTGRVTGEIAVGEEGKEQSTGALDQEEVAPAFEGGRLDLEDSESEQT